MTEWRIPADQTQTSIPALAGRSFRARVRAVNSAGRGPWSEWSEVAVPSIGTPSSPWVTPEQPGLHYGLPHRGSFNGWEFGTGTIWPIERSDGIFDMMALRVQDAPLVGDGSVFGWDSEDKRIITIDFAGGLAEMSARCEAEMGGGGWHLERDPLIAARCAMLRRHDDLPLLLDDWLIYARPRRFLAPQRRGEPTVVTAGWEAQDPAIYSQTLQTGTAMMGVAEWGRPYPRPSGAEGLTPGAWPPWAGWRYQGRGQGGLLAVRNEGCRETYLQARIQGPVRGPMLINQTTYQRLAFDITLGRNDWLDIDFRTGTVMLNGTSSRYWTITRDSVWFSVAGRGTTFIRYLAVGEVTDSTVTAWWRSAW